MCANRLVWCSYVVYSDHMHTEQTAADRVRDAIRLAERSVAWTALKAGMSPTTLTRRLNGGPDFTVTELAKLARVLDTTPGALLPDEFTTEGRS